MTSETKIHVCTETIREDVENVKPEPSLGKEM